MTKFDVYGRILARLEQLGVKFSFTNCLATGATLTRIYTWLDHESRQDPRLLELWTQLV